MPPRNTDPRRSGRPAARKPGSVSPRHRGYRPDAESQGKNRWSADDRAKRVPRRGADSGAERSDGRPDWTPPEARPKRPGAAASKQRRARAEQSERMRGGSSARPGGREAGDRPGRVAGDRGRRDSEMRSPRASDARGGRDSAARNGRGERPQRAQRPENGARSERRPAPDRRAIEQSSEFFGRPDRDMSRIEDVVLDRLQATPTSADDVRDLTFGKLGLGTNIVRTLGELGAETPFPIQAATIPDVLAGRHVLGRGRTGSGKTIAFGAPLVERLMENRGGTKRATGRAPRALILAPTRELALQIDRTVQPIARSVGLFTTQIYGGVPQARQVGALRRGVDIVIGTPGRIEDLERQGHLDLSEVSIVVLDEADHMCDLGFLEPVQRILRMTRPDAQRLLFSATLDTGVADLVDEFLPEPSIHEVAGETQETSSIDHRVLLIDQRDKIALVAELARGEGKTLVFARTRAFAEELAEEITDLGVPATSLHGDLNQARRTRSLERLTSGKVNVLVATDVAARGIHVDDIGLVIQADTPEEYKTYLHRAGRTGRAGKKGVVVTLVGRNRRRKMDELLARADIEAVATPARPGDPLIEELRAR